MEKTKTLVKRAYLIDNQSDIILFINNNAIAGTPAGERTPAKLLDLDHIFQTF